EFITLFSLELHITKGAITLNYINAGQHPVLMYQHDKLIRLEDSQKLLGVTKAEYKTTTLEFDASPMRLILYSDGAFDVFSKAGKHLGHKKFYEWVESSLAKSPADQLTFLRQKIEAYTGSGEESDDLAIIIIETKQS
ncbi:MAG TPA: SpoIIE family protein phosphatase, partial [Turneriella sp.]|nr:SpoIIE family protein phosphatase [Turneriella sp.]